MITADTIAFTTPTIQYKLEGSLHSTVDLSQGADWVVVNSVVGMLSIASTQLSIR